MIRAAILLMLASCSSVAPQPTATAAGPPPSREVTPKPVVLVVESHKVVPYAEDPAVTAGKERVRQLRENDQRRQERYQAEDAAVRMQAANEKLKWLRENCTPTSCPPAVAELACDRDFRQVDKDAWSNLRSQVAVELCAKKGN